MKLEDYAILPRSRNTWEVMDLGTLLFQRDGLTIVRTGLLLWLPIGALAALALLQGNLLWALVVIWLLRPLLGRVALYVYSRRVFSVELSPAQVVLAIPRFVFQGLFGLLLWRRISSSSRTFTDPIFLLEEMGKREGKLYRERVSDLLGGGTRGAMWRLGRGISLIEMCLTLAGIALIGMFYPDLFSEIDLLKHEGRIPMALQAALLLSQWVTVLFTEPLGTAAGFAMYLQRRSVLEGWDVELVFRSLAQRFQRATRTSAHVGLLALLWVGISAARPLQTAPEAAPPSAVERVYARPELSTTVERWAGVERTRPVGTNFIDLVAVFDAIVWVLLVALVLFLLYTLIRWAIGRNPAEVTKKRKPAEAVDVLLGLDLRADRLPADVSGAARSLWAAGDAKGALSLLYRGSLVSLRDRDRLLLEVGDTEARCVDKVQALGVGQRSEYFGQLTLRWQELAYGARRLAELEFELIFEGYQTHFGGKS